MSNTQARRNVGIMLVAIGMAPAISAAQIKYQPRPIKEFLAENHWVALPAPDKRTGPGSVIKVTKSGGAASMQWLGDLRRCGISDRDFRFVRGKYQAIGIAETFAVNAAIAAGFIAKLEGVADLDKAGGGIMRIEDSGGDVVDFLALANWMAPRGRAGRQMPPACTNFLDQQDAYLVTEAFRVSRATYALVDQNGARLPVAGAAFGRATGASEGAVTVLDDVYFGVRRVKQIAPALFDPSLAAQTIPEADGLLRLADP